MAKKAAVAVPAGFAFNFGGSTTIGEPTQYQENFRVRKNVADKLSSPTTIAAMHFNETKRQILVFGADGNTRKCNVDRLPDVATAKALWKKLQTMGKAQKTVVFVAAGGFSPDVWFYDVR